MCAALSFVFLLLGNVTSLLDMCSVVLCGLVTVVLFCEVNLGYTVSSCLVTLCLAFFIIPDKALVFLYFGVGAAYPLVKICTRKKKKVFSILIRAAVGAVSIAVYILLLRWLMPDEVQGGFVYFGTALGIFAFVLYDFLIDKFLILYVRRLSDVLNRIWKK